VAIKNYSSIGILGGMGPEATAELYKRIINFYQRERGAINDADYPNILINSVPVEDMLNDLDNRRVAITAQLQKGAKVLEAAGADFIVIPCNTATIFLKGVKSINIPIIDITEETAKEAKKLGSKKAGMLASASTIETKIYEDKLNEFGIEMLCPNDEQQKQVSAVIMNILAGKKTLEDTATLVSIANTMKDQGVDSIVLGCTELPLLDIKVDGVNVIDTIEVLANAATALADKV
jgi:aspartate racemase